MKNKATFYVNGDRIDIYPVTPPTPRPTVPGWVWVVFILLLVVIASSLDSWANPQAQTQQNSTEPY